MKKKNKWRYCKIFEIKPNTKTNHWYLVTLIINGGQNIPLQGVELKSKYTILSEYGKFFWTGKWLIRKLKDRRLLYWPYFCEKLEINKFIGWKVTKLLLRGRLFWPFVVKASKCRGLSNSRYHEFSQFNHMGRCLKVSRLRCGDMNENK